MYGAFDAQRRRPHVGGNRSANVARFRTDIQVQPETTGRALGCDVDGGVEVPRRSRYNTSNLRQRQMARSCNVQLR